MFRTGSRHTVRAMESGSVIMEVKDGKWEAVGEEALEGPRRV